MSDKTIIAENNKLRLRIAKLEAALVKVRAELLEWTPRYRFIDTALEAIEVVLVAPK